MIVWFISLKSMLHMLKDVFWECQACSDSGCWLSRSPPANVINSPKSITSYHSVHIVIFQRRVVFTVEYVLAGIWISNKKGFSQSSLFIQDGRISWESGLEICHISQVSMGKVWRVTSVHGRNFMTMHCLCNSLAVLKLEFRHNSKTGS